MPAWQHSRRLPLSSKCEASELLNPRRRCRRRRQQSVERRQPNAEFNFIAFAGPMLRVAKHRFCLNLWHVQSVAVSRTPWAQVAPTAAFARDVFSGSEALNYTSVKKPSHHS